MNPLILGGLVSAAGNILGTVFNNSQSQNASTLNYQRQVDFWNMQNRYNTPKAQIERLQAAGLNPNLIYGSGSANTGNSSGSVSPQMPNLQPYRFDQLANIGPLLLQEKSVNADARNKDSLSRYNDAKTITEAIRQIGYRLDNDITQEERDRLLRKRDKLDALMDYNVDAVRLKNEYQESDNSLFDLTMDARVKQYFKNNDLTVAQTRVAMSTVKRLHAATALDWKRCAKVAEEIALLSEEIAYKKRENKFGDDTYRERLDRYSAELTNIFLSGDSKKLDNYLESIGFTGTVLREFRGAFNALFDKNDIIKARNFYNPDFNGYGY